MVDVEGPVTPCGRALDHLAVESGNPRTRTERVSREWGVRPAM